MARLAAEKKLFALDKEVEALEEQLRALELRAVGTEVAESERRQRYFSVADPAVRRQLIGTARALYERRAQWREAAVEYWSTVVAETRSKLEDLRSDSPLSRWRRRAWWDLLTIYWVLGGAGWLAFQFEGAVVATLVTVIWGWFILRRREQARQESIRQGESLLHSSGIELQQARQVAAELASSGATFSAAEEQTGRPDEATRAV